MDSPNEGPKKKKKRNVLRKASRPGKVRNLEKDSENVEVEVEEEEKEKGEGGMEDEESIPIPQAM